MQVPAISLSICAGSIIPILPPSTRGLCFWGGGGTLPGNLRLFGKNVRFTGDRLQKHRCSHRKRDEDIISYLLCSSLLCQMTLQENPTLYKYLHVNKVQYVLRVLPNIPTIDYVGEIQAAYYYNLPCIKLRALYSLRHIF